MGFSSGWTASNVASACIVVVHIMNAFNNGLGAAQQYRDSHAFLSSLYLVVNYISDAQKAASLADGAQSQIQTISAAYADFYAYVAQFAHIGFRDRNDLGRALASVRWSLNELDGEVQAMKSKCCDAIAVMETLIIMDLSNRMNDLLAVVDRPGQSIQATERVVHDLKDQLRNLAHVATCYKTLLDLAKPPQTDQDLLSFDDTRATINLQAIRTSLNKITNSQSELEATLTGLTARLNRRVSIERRATDDNATFSAAQTQTRTSSFSFIPTSTLTMMSNPWKKSTDDKDSVNVNPKEIVSSSGPSPKSSPQNTTSWFSRTFTASPTSKNTESFQAREDQHHVAPQLSPRASHPPPTPMSPASNPWYTPPTISSFKFSAPTKCELNPVVDVIGGFAAVTGDAALAVTAHKLGGAVRIIGAINPLSSTVGGWLANGK